MLTPLQNAAQITQTVAVFPATSFCVEMGANTGDPIGVIDDLALDDVYQLASGQLPKELRLTARADGQLLIAGNSDTGSAGAHLHLDCLITLMPDVGANVDGIVMVEVDNAGMIAAVYLLPLAPLEPQLGYTLVRKTRDGADGDWRSWPVFPLPAAPKSPSQMGHCVQLKSCRLAIVS